MPGGGGCPVRAAVCGFGAVASVAHALDSKNGKIALSGNSSDSAAPVRSADAEAHRAPEAALDGGLSEREARRADLLWAAGLALAILLVFGVLALFRGAATPVLVSLAFAYALDPVADWLEARGLSRTLAVLAIFLGINAVVAASLVYLVPALGAEVAKVPDFLQAIAQKAVPRLEALLGQRLPDNVRDAAAALAQEGGGLAQRILPGLAGVLMGALGGTASLLSTALGLLLIPVLTFYLLRDYDRLVAWMRDLIPRRYERLVSGRFSEVDAVLGSFLRGQMTVGAILTAIYAVGLSMARLDLAVVIGAVAGFGTMIPYVGPGIGALLAVLALAVSWQGPWQGAVAVATFAGAMGFEGLFLTPRIVGQKVGLSAVAVMIGILVFGGLFGFVGVLLAVPVTAALKVAAKVVLQRYRRSAVYRGTP
jgi:predicted PurR-regulated permease PerM